MKHYTVHEFYFQVNELLEKYKAKKPDHKLRVTFEITDGSNDLTAAFYVSYGHKKHEPVDRVFAVGSTPGICLQKLEDELRNNTEDKAILKSMAVNLTELVKEPAEHVNGN